MGATQSKPAGAPTVVHNDTPVEFSQDVVDYLSDRQAAPGTTPERQRVLDDHIRSRIQDEILRLRAEEDDVQREIHGALERENLDHEVATESGGSSSAILLGDIEQVKAKIDKYQSRHQLSDFVSAREAGEAVVSCYRFNTATPLDCWQQVARFKKVVAEAEREHLASLRT